MSKDLIDIISAHQKDFGNIVAYDLNNDQVVIFDFTASNTELDSIDIDDEHSFSTYIARKLDANNSAVGIGGYNEDRIIYKRSKIFTTNEERSIHLGIDIWATAGSEVYAPLDGVVHSFKNNDAHGDYGPTIILQHNLDHCTFYTLYGHLDLLSIRSLKKQQQVKKGAVVGRLGEYHENVHWPPHLHFQLIRDIGPHSGDYPGVAAPSKRSYFLHQCPDPNLILKMEKLKQ